MGAGFDDEKAQAIAEVTERDSALFELHTTVGELRQQYEALDSRFDSLRDEVAARIEASEQRVRTEVIQLGSDLRVEMKRGDEMLRTELRTEMKRSEDTLRTETVQLGTQLRSEMTQLGDRLETEMTQLGDRLETEMTQLGDRLETEMTRLETEMTQLGNRLETGTRHGDDLLRTELGARVAELTARIDGMDARLRLMLWLLGAGLTLYTGTTISLMVLLFQSMVG